MKKLSVIVPVYNGEKFLKRCVDSILTQKLEDFELILVDDGSTDNSFSICQEYSNSDNRIIVVQKENGGPHAARKSGLSVANGEYVGFVDCDDYIDSDMYQEMIDEAQKDNCDIVAGAIVLEYVNESKVLYNECATGFYSENEIKQMIIPKMLIHSGFVTYGIIPGIVVKIFKREILEKAFEKLPECANIGEDVATTAYCMMEAKSLKIIDSAAYHYIQNESSLIHGFDEHRMERITALAKCLFAIENEDYIQQANLYIVFLVFNFACEIIKKSELKGKQLIKVLKDVLNNDVLIRSIKATETSNISFEDQVKIFLMRYHLIRLLIFFLRR